MRYLRNMVLCGLLLTAFLTAAWDKLTFQGYITGDDGLGYAGPLTTGVCITTTSDVTANLSAITDPDKQLLIRELGTSSIQNGSYTITLKLDNAEINKLMMYENLYLSIYLSRKSNDTNIFVSPNLLTPCVHILGAPIAFKVRGVNVQHITETVRDNDNELNIYKGNNLAIGSGSIDTSNPGGITVGTNGRIGVGTDNPQQALHVSANNTTNKLVALDVTTINSEAVVRATTVRNVRWE